MAHQITRTLTTIFALTLISTCLAHAQDKPIQSSKWDPAIWQAGHHADPRLNLRRDDKLILFTTAEPTRGQSCHLNSIDTNQIVCSRFGRKPQVYRVDDIAALVLPGYHTPTLIALIAPVALVVGEIVGAVILMPTAVAAGVVLAIAAGYDSGWVMLTALFNSYGHSPDQLLYLAPGQQLHFKLRDANGHPIQFDKALP
jgi:hypothetical protein